MILLYVAIVLLSLMGVGLHREADCGQALSIQQCNAIKGVSILLVFVSHANEYITSCGYPLNLIGDDLFIAANRIIGQFCVVMFLFYSGYGTQLSVLNKGNDYVKRIPRRRCLATLLNFDVAVLVFLVINLLLGNSVTLSRFSLSLLAWESIGNSNWYIFVIIACYFCSYLSARITSDPRKSFLILMVLIVTLIVVLCVTKSKEKWWYDTLLAYPAGAFVALCKDGLSECVKRHYVALLLCAAVVLCSWVAMALFVMNGQFHAWTYNVASVLFAFLVLLITMRVKISNPVLVWLGANLFPFYIYQRLPMMIISQSFPEFVASHALVFCIISVAFTALFAYIYRFVKISID